MSGDRGASAERPTRLLTEREQCRVPRAGTQLLYRVTEQVQSTVGPPGCYSNRLTELRFGICVGPLHPEGRARWRAREERLREPAAHGAGEPGPAKPNPVTGDA